VERSRSQSFRDEQGDQRSDDPAADDPDRRARDQRDADRDTRPTMAATSSRLPVISPTASPIIAAGR
jgi:hypothetical protein